MKTFMIPAAFAASMLMPAAASAQAVPPAVIAVVDLQKVSVACNACKTANAALESQATAEENREKALVTSLQAEQKSIQTAIDLLKGAEPDAALQARIKAFQTKQQQAQETAGRGRQQLQRNQAYIQQQIQAKLNPIYQSVMQRRGANVLMEVSATLGTAKSIDVTTDVATALNAALPSLATTAPAQAPAPAKPKPQGR